MIEVKGEHNTAVCFCGELEKSAQEQILTVCQHGAFKDNKIRIMPDVHAGMGCTIGTTMTIKDKVVPGMVGVDIGCGMQTVELAEKSLDFQKLDNIIRKNIPAGFAIRKTEHALNEQIDLSVLNCIADVSVERGRLSIGTLGGGNHFIEVDKSEDGRLFLVVHSGSRNLGLQVAQSYQRNAVKQLGGSTNEEIKKQVEPLKADGMKKRDVQQALWELRQAPLENNLPRTLAYVSGKLFDDYIADMKIIQAYAVLNRRAMVDTIIELMGLTKVDEFTTIHNYIDTDSMILRKGAVSAKAGERLLIPINMRDGSLICVGKGNADWNFSAPHGAGRLMSRTEAKAHLSIDEYKKQMDGIFTTSISLATLDEAPMAYKDMDVIVNNIGPTAEIKAVIKPIYNFKAA
ncbi:MAG: RtcB family protein [Elusimicrobiota bacterium]|jgi:RNA-splicing ligase RtcB|nr:RtcB family protein [Elusimicrobiota bacterium]